MMDCYNWDRIGDKMTCLGCGMVVATPDGEVLRESDNMEQHADAAREYAGQFVTEMGTLSDSVPDWWPEDWT